MQLKTTLAALLVVSAFAGAIPAASQGGTTSPGAGATAGPSPVQNQEGEVSGENVTIRNVSLQNVTLQSVAVSRLVVNATEDGEQTETELRNVTASAVEVDNATIRNATFGRINLDRQLATDLLGQVGTGVTPEGTIPSQPLEAGEISDRVLVGVEFGELRVTDAALGNVTVEGTTSDDRQDVQNATLTGLDATLTGGAAQGVTIVGLSADESDAASNETTDG